MKFYILLFFLLQTTLGIGQNEHKVLTMSTQSSIEIKGKTNVSKFECNLYSWQNEPSNKIILNQNSGFFDVKNNNLALSICNIECGNPIINEDLALCLKAKRKVFIKLQVKQLQGDFSNGNLKLIVDVEIAGISKSYAMFCGANFLSETYN
jgi:hypothetical protein